MKSRGPKQRSGALPWLALPLLAALTLALVARRPTEVAPAERDEPRRPLESRSFAELPRVGDKPASPFAWLIAAGGPYPSSNQISLAQDAMLAQRVFGGSGLTLFTGAPVQVSTDDAELDLVAALKRELGHLVDPRGGRDTTFREAPVAAQEIAEEGTLLTALSDEVVGEGPPFLLFIAAHGEQGESAADNAVLLRDGTAITPTDLATVLDAAHATRRVRVVIASCFSGGFAEIAFRGGVAENGAATTDRCGFFASTWDLEASGCDPDPERGAQEGYSLRFLHALRGEGPSGAALPTVDFDRDGHITMLEAHTRARIDSGSIDVPTTTSERYLRELAPREGEIDAIALPEEEAVVRELSAKLRLSVSSPGVQRSSGAADARAALEALEARIEEGTEALSTFESIADERATALHDAIVWRYPALDDPYHPLFDATLRDHAAELDAFLRDDEMAQELHGADEALAEASRAFDELERKRAMLLRLVRAYETIDLAGRIRAEERETYLRLLRCERSEL